VKCEKEDLSECKYCSSPSMEICICSNKVYGQLLPHREKEDKGVLPSFLPLSLPPFLPVFVVVFETVLLYSPGWSQTFFILYLMSAGITERQHHTQPKVLYLPHNCSNSSSVYSMSPTMTLLFDWKAISKTLGTNIKAKLHQK
jgi:hypothetical protein